MIAIKNKKGFTLIELLIVIVIIGILAVALLPTLLNGPKEARDMSRIVDLSSTRASIMRYLYTEDGSVGDLTTGDLDAGGNSELVFDAGPTPTDPKTTTVAPVGVSGGTAVDQTPATIGSAGKYQLILNPDVSGSTPYQIAVLARMEDDTKGNFNCDEFDEDGETLTLGTSGDCFAVLIK